MQDTEMLRYGTVAMWCNERGYGFIRSADVGDVYVNGKVVGRMMKLHTGDAVLFKCRPDKFGTDRRPFCTYVKHADDRVEPDFRQHGADR